MGIPAANIGTIEWLVTSLLAGAIVGLKTDVLQQTAPHIIRALGWDLDSLACWRVLCKLHTANTAAAATTAVASARNQVSNARDQTQPVAHRAGAGTDLVDTDMQKGRVDMSIGAAVDKGLSNENFDLSQNLRRGDQRQVDPAIFEMEGIMKEQGCDFDTARLIYNQRKMLEAGLDPETGLPKAKTEQVGTQEHFGDRASDIEQVAPKEWCETPAVAVVYHQADGMIPYRFASLAAAMKQHGAFAPGGILYDPSGVPCAREVFELKLRRHDVNSHMYPLSTHPQEWAQLVNMVERLLGESR